MANDKDRRRRAEEKRKRREARKRKPAPQPSPAAPVAASVAPPLPSLSDTLDDFATPLTSLAAALDPALLRRMLLAAAGIWNAQLGRATAGPAGAPSASEVADLAVAMGTSAQRVQRALDHLGKSRQARFRDDPREFLDIETFWGDDEIRIRVMGASLPSAVSPQSQVLSPFDARAGGWPERLRRVAPSPPTGPIDPRVGEQLERLQRSGFANESCERAATALADLPDRRGLAEAMTTGFLATTPPPGAQEVWRFASAVTYIAGAEAARAAGDKAVKDYAGIARQTAYKNLRWALGMAPDVPMTPNQRQALAKHTLDYANAVEESPGERAHAFYLIATLPPEPAAVAAGSFLAAYAQQGHGLEFALEGALSPLDLMVRKVFWAFLAGRSGDAGRARLAALSSFVSGEPEWQALHPLLGEDAASAASDEPLPEAYFNWPVERAEASSPDGYGCQMLYVLRRRPDGSRAMVGGLVSARRGLIEFLVDPAPTPEAEQALRADFEETPFWPIDGAYVAAMLRAGVAKARSEGFPLPLAYHARGAVLAGVSEAGAPDLGAVADALNDPGLLPFTGALWRHGAFTTRIYFEADAPAMHEFLAETTEAIAAMPGLEEPQAEPFPPDIAGALDNALAWPVEAAGLAIIDGIARRHLPALLTADERSRWRDALRHDAYLFSRGGVDALAGLAATAAKAIDPASTVPLEEQPFVRDLLRVSALWQYLD